MRVFSKLLLIVFALPLVWSCETLDEPRLITQTGAMITDAPSNLVLTREEADDFIVFNVSSVDFGVSVSEVTYTIQIDAAGNNFAAPVAVGSSPTTTVEVNIDELNRRAVAKGLEAEVAGNIEFRVSATTTRAGLPTVNGDAVTISITPYSTEVELPFLRVPGDYQGWNPGNDNTIIYSESSDDVYEGFVHILSGSGEFKFITGPAWGDFPDFGVGATAGMLSEGGGNLKIEDGFGTYKVKVNKETLTYEKERVGIWGIIGDATPGGWDTETPMTFDRDENILKITIDLVPGAFKFRTQTWDMNYGMSSEEGVAGFNNDGADIPIAEAGNYTITFDLKTPWEIRYSVTKN
ncbi:SusE domain-containing protein [Belliella pelovolcani]|uniref:SusE domain-containing protein n=1 Tax=Belliella pelovolcani TaxID=529505 RepID=UPI0039193081